MIKYKSQQGAALLLFMLILITASAYTLLRNLNPAAKSYSREEITSRALAEAKQALIGYAVTYPDRINEKFGPGYLPCPDITNDGKASGACSFNTTFIGRFPWETLQINDLTDGSGQRLWYALSENYRNNPKLEPLNSETEGQLTLDGVDDIVALIIAPGEPVGEQNRDPSESNISNEIANYLEGENADIGTTFDSDFTISDAGDFNDKVLAISRQELMSVVEKRVLGEVKQIFSNYFSSYDGNAYPWLSSFADPKSIEKRLTGKHNDDGGQTTTLKDTSVDFKKWGVANGDVVWNLTEGSYGTVSEVGDNTLTIGMGLKFGKNNAFNEDDEYFVDVDVTTIIDAFTGIASTSSDLVLKDDTKNFKKLDIRSGDILENITDKSSRIIKKIEKTMLTVKALTGDTKSSFKKDDEYRIRTSTGRATAGTNGLTLEDKKANFKIMGMQPGDLIKNISDNSYGRVTEVTVNNLTVSELLFGEDNIFNADDYYALPRFNSTVGARKGLLAIHDVGEPFKTDIRFDWKIEIETINPDEEEVELESSAEDWIGLKGYMTKYAKAGTEEFNDTVGTCIWLIKDLVDCFARYKDIVDISGTVTKVSGVTITDKEAKFNTGKINVNRGYKIIRNPPSDEKFVVTKAKGQTQLVTDNYISDENPDFKEGDSYKIIAAAHRLTGTVKKVNSTADSDMFTADGDVDFIKAGVEVGDIVENHEDGFGEITAVGKKTINTTLYGETQNDFVEGEEESYTIYYDYVDSREHLIHAKFKGNAKTKSAAGKRVREVCLGYNEDCTEAADADADAVEINNLGEALFTINDYQEDGTKVETATFKPKESKGSFRVSNIDFGLSKKLSKTTGEIPAWFINNDWYKLVYIALSPGAASKDEVDCDKGGVCLSLENIRLETPNNPKVTTTLDVPALVIAAGAELKESDSITTCPAATGQDRTTGQINEYFEGENCDQDDKFQEQSETPKYNDQVLILAPPSS